MNRRNKATVTSDRIPELNVSSLEIKSLLRRGMENHSKKTSDVREKPKAKTAQKRLNLDEQHVQHVWRQNLSFLVFPFTRKTFCIIYWWNSKPKQKREEWISWTDI